MSTPIDSNSTRAEVEAAYLDNADYEERGSVTKANTFVTACRHLMLRRPRSAGHGNARVDLAPELIERQMTDAQTWIGANNTSGGGAVTHVDFTNYRS